MVQSTKPTKSAKPAKPHKDFPLTPHPTGRWCKKVRGKLAFFGKWNDPQGALERWLDQKDDLLAGRTPRVSASGQLTVAELVNRFLNSKRMLVEAKELSNVTWCDYKAVGERLVEALGRNRLVTDLHPDDFERLRAIVAKGKLGRGVGPVAIANFITRARVMFKYALDNDLIERQVRFGQGFRRPSKTAMRKLRNERGLRMFSPAELQRIIAAADQPLKAMILLGANCGFGNADCGQLPLSSLDLDRGWIDFPRPKTHVRRRCPLWPETVATLREWLCMRPQPKSAHDAHLIFLTRCGVSWHKNVTPDNPISKEMRKLLKALDIKRKGLAFYGLRHGFETIAGQTRDQVAVDRVMGHAEGQDDMAAIYREDEGDATLDDRLRAVVTHVRTWLWPDTAQPPAKAPAKTKPKAR